MSCTQETHAAKVFQFFDTSRENVNGDRMKELLSPFTPIKERIHHQFTAISLRNKSYSVEAARVLASFFEKLIENKLLRELISVDLADMIAGKPEVEALKVLKLICDSLEPIKTLERIDISDNALGEKGIRACFGVLKNQNELKHIYFCNNGISARAAQVIADEIFLCQKSVSKLETFHFYNNMSGDDGAAALAQMLAITSALSDLRFSATRVQRLGGVEIGKLLSNSLRNLQRLDLSDNTFGAEGAALIAKALLRQPYLEQLNLRDACIEDEGLIAIAKAFQKCTFPSALKLLDISGNDLSSQSIEAFTAALPALRCLEVFKLEENDIGSAGAKAIAEAFLDENMLTNLSVLWVNTCEIGSVAAVALVKVLVRRQTMLSVQLDGNYISRKAAQTISELLEKQGRDPKIISVEDNESDIEEDVDEVTELANEIKDVLSLQSETAELDFSFYDNTREVVDASRMRALLKGSNIQTEGVSLPLTYKSITLRGKSYTEQGARVLADVFLQRLQGLKAVDMADIIAGRSEEEALRVLQIISSALHGQKLESIDLSDNALGEKGVRACFAMLLPQPHLKHLYFCNNGISAAAAKVIADEVVLQAYGSDSATLTASSLETFHFYNNMSGPDGCISIANMLTKCHNLTSFRFASARAGPEASAVLSRSIASSLKNLYSLDLSDCSFIEVGVMALSDAISSQRALRYLKLRDASLGPDGARAIADALLSSNTKLKQLDLAGNELGSEGLISIIPMIIAQESLEILSLDENEISSKGIRAFVNQVIDCSPSFLGSIRELSYYGNEITANGALCIIQSLLPMAPLLCKVNLDGNCISSRGLDRIQQVLVQMGKVHALESFDDNDEAEESESEE